MLGGEPQVDGERIEIIDEAGDNCGECLLPVGAEAVESKPALGDGPLTGWFFDVGGEVPPLGLEGVLVPHGRLGGGVTQAMDHTSLAKAFWKVDFDRREDTGGAIGDDKERSSKAARAFKSARKSPQASVYSVLAAESATRCGWPSVSMPQATSTGSARECWCILKLAPSR